MKLKKSKPKETLNSAARRERLYPYILLAPALIIMICIVFIPVVQALISSFKYYDLRYPKKTQFIGLQNYIDILTKDRQFWPSFWKTILWVVLGVGFQFLFGYLRITKPKHHGYIKNILPTQARWRPHTGE